MWNCVCRRNGKKAFLKQREQLKNTDMTKSKLRTRVAIATDFCLIISSAIWLNDSLASSLSTSRSKLFSDP